MKKVFALFITSLLMMFAVHSAYAALPSDTSTSSGVHFQASNGDTSFSMINGKCTLNGKEINCDDAKKSAEGIIKGGLAVMTIFSILGLVSFIFWIIMLIHALSNPIKDKAVWILVLFLVPFGFLIYYFVVKRNYTPASVDSVKKNENVL